MRTIKLMTSLLLACTALAACKKDPATEHETVKYTVSATAGENGKATASVAEAEAGAEVTFTATPDEGFAFEKWTVEKGSVTVSDPAQNPLKIVMPKENISLSASFVVLKFPHAIKVAEAENGTVTVDGDLKEAQEGDAVKVTAVPAEGFEFVGWTVEGVEVEDLTANPLTFTMPDAEVTVAAEFKALVDIRTETKDYLIENYADEGEEMWEAMSEFFNRHMTQSLRVENPLTGEEESQDPWDTNFDGILTAKEVSAVKVLNLSDDEDVHTLKFIHCFTGLEVLACKGNYTALWGYGETIDLSSNINLKYIELRDVDLDISTLVLGEMPELEYLDLNYTWLAELDITGFPKLRFLDVRGTDIEEIDITGIEATSGWEFKLRGQTVILRADQEEAFVEAYPDIEYVVK